MKELLTGKLHEANGIWRVIVNNNGIKKTFVVHPNSCLHVGMEFFENKKVRFNIIRFCKTHQCDISAGPCTLDCAYDEIQYAKITDSEKEINMIHEGSLIQDKQTGKLVVRYNKTGKKSTDALENLELDHDSFIDYYIDGKIVEPWVPVKVKFEIVKKFLANETQYIAKLIEEKKELGWPQIAKEWNEHVAKSSENYINYTDWLSTHFNPPTRKKV